MTSRLKSRIFNVSPLIAVLFLTGSITACGQKGPLYLPGDKPEKPVESKAEEKEQPSTASKPVTSTQ